MSTKPKFTYEQYLKAVSGIPGMTEQQFNESFGIQTDEAIPPLHITPKRNHVSSIESDAKMANEVKERRRKKPVSAKAPKEPKPKKPKEPIQKLPRKKRPKMSEEERRLRRNELAREHRLRRKEAGDPPRVYTQEQRERQRRHQKEYYLRKKGIISQKHKEYKAKLKAEGRSSYKKVPPELRKKTDFAGMMPEQISEHKKQKQKETQKRYYQKHKAMLNQKRKKYKSSAEYKAKEAAKARHRRAVKRLAEVISPMQMSGTTITKR